LAGAPVLAVSSITGAGLDELRAEILRQLDGFQARRPTGLFRIPLDRAFVIKGHGTVVTGTAMGAEVRVGDKLRVLPAGAEVRVRSIQVHGQVVESAGLCQRVALNLSGAERVELQRGDVLADHRLDLTTTRVDVSIELRAAAKRPLKNNSRVRMFIGTAEALGRAILLEPADAIAPKNGGLVQLVLQQPVVALFGDRFVIRDETNLRTLGGGVVLNPAGRKLRKPLELYLERLKTLRASSGGAAVEAMLNLQDTFALTAARLAQLLNAPHREVETALGDSRFVKLSLGDEEGFTTRSKWEELKRFVLEALAAHHRANPLAPGMEMEALRERLPYEVGARAFRALIDRLGPESEVAREESALRLKSHRIQLGADESRLTARVQQALKQANFQPPDLKQLAEGLKLSPPDAARLRTLMAALERQGRVVKVGDWKDGLRACRALARSDAAPRPSVRRCDRGRRSACARR